MTKVTTPKKTLKFDPDKVADMHDQILVLLGKAKPTVGELLVLLGNLGYSVGASIEGYKEKGPSIQEVEKLYYENPKQIGVALMVQGLTVASWYAGWEELQTEDNSEE